ncbi:CorA family divalent cation transporter [Haliscomenobacter sp.]|uniref:CorA family divalent cation transporter n=1 Tax=Haliscomenobacter sp. TaxID=2717303 RepID=UPI0029F4A35E|nr:CorA family divalent cation transporter [Haliscomenobacter sp.]
MENALFEKPIATQEPLYSTHAFLFPFEWTYQKTKSQLLEDQTDLLRIEQLMALDSSRWERRASWLQPQSLVQFNELVYFYEFVRPVLYDSGKDDSLQRHYYFKAPAESFEYVIELNNGKTYRLDIDDIVVSFFNTGVGVLAFHLLNKDQKQSAPQDILNINAFGRRVYPPFLQTQKDLIGQQAFFEDNNWLAGLQGTQKANQMAKSIRLEANAKPWIVEDFLSWVVNQNPEREPELIQQLLPIPLREEVQFAPVLDDRMFTVCWYGNKALTEYIKGKDFEQDFKTNPWWYRYLFVDSGDATCPNLAMRHRLLEEATNARWANYGTFYGISRYSFVTLTDEMSVSYEGFAKIICSHVQTMYYKVSLLGLVQRACLLRFSQEITAISQLPKKDPNIGARVSSLFKQYIRFVNKIYFREVTAQEQGIELYDILQSQMRLEKQVKDLEHEIQELHGYVSMLEEEQRNDKLDVLTYIGALFVVPSFIGTYFGVNNFKIAEHWLGLSLLSLTSAILALAVVRGNRKMRIIWLIILAILMVYTLIIYPINKFEQ